MPLIAMPSGKELEENRDYKLLLEGPHIMEVASIDIETGKTSQWSPKPHDEWKVKVKVISSTDGQPVIYEDGTEPDPTKDVTLLLWVDPNRVGVKPQPSKARRFLTAVLGVGVEDAILVESFDDLIGKRFIGVITHKQDQKGTTRDRIETFMALRARPRPAAPKPTEQVEAEAVDMLSKVKEVFGEDAPVF